MTLTRPLFRGLCAALLAAAGTASAQTDACEPCSALNGESCNELYLTLSVNGQQIPRSHLVLHTPTAYWLPESAVSLFNVKQAPEQSARQLCSERYYPHTAFGDTTVNLDLNRLHADLLLPWNLFARQSLSRQQFVYSPPDAATPGVTMQYDIAAQNEDEMTASSFLDFNVTAGTGFGKTNFTLNDAFDDAELVRRQTYWRQDDAKRLTTLILGDSAINTSRAFRGNVVYGGISYSTNYELRRGIAYYPTVQLQGIAELPSTVDLYINNVLQKSENVAPGPFEVEPQVGFAQNGEVQLVIRDSLGRQQVITTEFFTDQELLNPGFADWSLDTGYVRQNFGIRDFDYGDGFVSGSYAYGLHQHFTGAVEAESSGEHGAAGASGIWLMAANTKLHFSAAGSHHDERSSGAWGRFRFSLQRNHVGFNIGGEVASEEFFRLGMTASSSLNRFNGFGNIFVHLNRFGSFNAGLVYSEDQARLERRAASFGYNLSAGAYHFNLNGSADLDDSDNWFFGMGISRSFGETQHRVTASFSENRQRYTYSMGYQPQGERHSYQLSTSGGPDQDSVSALGFSGFNDDLHYNLNTYYYEGDSMPLSLQLRGGFGLLKGYTFAARDINHGFLLVHTPEHPGVGVIRAGRAGATDKDGFLLLPIYDYFRPIEVELDPSDLPLGVSGTSLRRTVVPGFQAALYVPFDITYSRHGSVILKDSQGRVIGPGVETFLNGGEEAIYTSAYGEVFLDTLKPQDNVLEVPERNCSVRFDYPADSRDPLPFIGTYICGSE